MPLDLVLAMMTFTLGKAEGAGTLKLNLKFDYRRSLDASKKDGSFNRSKHVTSRAALPRLRRIPPSAKYLQTSSIGLVDFHPEVLLQKRYHVQQLALMLQTLSVLQCSADD